jgi:hypothetical protein
MNSLQKRYLNELSCTFPFLFILECSSRPRHEHHLVRWACSQLHDIESLSKMVDPSIQGECSEILLSRFADIISRCIQVIIRFIDLRKYMCCFFSTSFRCYMLRFCIQCLRSPCIILIHMRGSIILWRSKSCQSYMFKFYSIITFVFDCIHIFYQFTIVFWLHFPFFFSDHQYFSFGSCGWSENFFCRRNQSPGHQCLKSSKTYLEL